MKNDVIKIRGARVHNLKNVDADIPLGKVTCISGPSGSGKSSLAFHTLFGESKRRYLNSFPTYLKFFTERPPAADVDSITPVLPAFGLHQVNPIIGARSMVMDVMGLTPLLQNFFYRYGEKICPEHKVLLQEGSIEETLISYSELKNSKRFYLFIDKTKYLEVHSIQDLPSYSFRDGGRDIFDADDKLWEVGRFSQKSMKGALEELQRFTAKGVRDFWIWDGEELESIRFSYEYHCPKCEKELLKEKRLNYFSPYNALGACSVCSGYGANLEYDYNKFYNDELSVDENAIQFLTYKKFAKFNKDLLLEMKAMKISTKKPLKELPKKFFNMLHDGGDIFCGFGRMIQYMEKRRYKPHIRILIRSLQKEVECSNCQGTRLGSVVDYYGVKTSGKYQTIKDYIQDDLSGLFERISKSKIKELTDIKTIVTLANDLGLGHLSLLRKTKSLSAGEYQRLLMMKYLSFKGTSSLFVFDEPSLGLSEIEQKSLLKGIQNLTEQGNTVVLVDHSEYLKSNSDHLIEMGPAAGENGGKVVARSQKESSDYKIEYPKIKTIKKVSTAKKGFFGIKKPAVYGKEFQDVFIPYNKLTLIKGASGSGKTAVITHALANAVAKKLGIDPVTKTQFDYAKLYLDQDFKDITVVDANLNRYTSRSTVGTMTGFTGLVRKHFASTPQAKSMGLKEGHFSSNSVLGQCSVCEGKGILTIEMQFLEDVVMTCEHCNGKKLEPRYAEIFDGKIEAWEAYHKPFSEIVDLIRLTPKYKTLWEYMKLLNVGYLSLERTMMSLSGGERQRLYLLSKMASKLENQLIIFENLSFGLSAKEIDGMGQLLMQIVNQNNTLVLIDQNPLFEGFSHYQVSF